MEKISLIKRIVHVAHIFLLDRHILQVKPWEDPRRSPEDRARWIESEPKSLKGKAA